MCPALCPAFDYRCAALFQQHFLAILAPHDVDQWHSRLLDERAEGSDDLRLARRFGHRAEEVESGRVAMQMAAEVKSHAASEYTLAEVGLEHREHASTLRLR